MKNIAPIEISDAALDRMRSVVGGVSLPPDHTWAFVEYRIPGGGEGYVIGFGSVSGDTKDWTKVNLGFCQILLHPTIAAKANDAKIDVESGYTFTLRPSSTPR